MDDPSKLEFIIKVLLAIAILVGNSLVIYLYFVEKTLSIKQANRFVISLSICDLLVALIFIPCHELFHESIQRLIPLPIAGYVASIATLGSLWNLTALTYDRYVAVFDGLRYEVIMTNKKVTMMMVAIWISDFFITFLPLSWRFVTQETTNSLILHVYQFILVIIMTVVHIVLIGVYIALFKTNRHHLKFSQQQEIRFVSQRSKEKRCSEEKTRRHCRKKKTPCCIKYCRRISNEIAFRSDDICIETVKSEIADRAAAQIINNDVLRQENNCTTISVLNKKEPLKSRAGRALERLSNSRTVCVELRAAKVVLILFAFNTVCWLPTVTLNVVYLVSWLKDQPHIPRTLRSVSSYCFLIYSLVNPWIYGLLKADFKRAMKKHILRKIR